MCWELIAISNFPKIRMRVDILRTEKCNVTFGLEYTLNHLGTFRHLFVYRDDSLTS